MPVPLGDFISEYVYNKKLLSKHHIQEGECVTFVDVTNGREERCGTSWRVSDLLIMGRSAKQFPSL